MKISRLLTPFAALFLSLSLTACENSLPEVSYPQLRFNHLPAIKLDVAKIEILEKYQSPLQDPNVEHKLPLAPAMAMRNWAKDRLRAAGTNGIARFIIIDASVKAEALTKKKSLKAAFTIDQSTRYHARLSAKLEVETAAGLGRGFAEAKSSRQRTMPEDASINERDDALYIFVEAAAIDFDKAMAQNIEKYLGPFRR